MKFEDLLRLAKENNQAAITELLDLYQPLLLRESIVDGVLDEDLYQELRIVFLRCVQKFSL